MRYKKHILPFAAMSLCSTVACGHSRHAHGPKSHDLRFVLDKHEVVVENYLECVAQGDCTALEFSESPQCNTTVEHRSHPANCVALSQAIAYCKWRGGRLPTLGEWMSVATQRGKTKFPWGNTAPTCERAVVPLRKSGEPKIEDLGCGRGGTWPVGSKPGGASPEGVLDLIGNAFEWTSTRVSENGFAVAGGQWSYSVGASDLWFPMNKDLVAGFRCAQDL